MTKHWIHQDGPNGDGLSDGNSRRTLPSVVAGDVWAFKDGAPFVNTSQSSLTAPVEWTSWSGTPLLMPEYISTAGNFGTINVSNTGVTKFRNLRFKNILNGSGNGAVINSSVNGGRASTLDIEKCWFQTTRWNAIRFNGTNTGEAAINVRIVDNDFFDIGEDCVFGGILTGEIAWNRLWSMSTRTDTGDGIGYINADPQWLWIHHNYINHSAVDSKQCIIIDTSGAATGRVIIEDNTLVGYGSATLAPTVHTVVICDAPLTLRRNRIYCYGLAAGTNHPTDVISDNIIYVGNRDANNVIVAISGNSGRVDGNDFIALNALPSSLRCVVMANGVTAGSIRNNIFSGIPIPVKSDSLGYNPTCANNDYWNYSSARLDRDGVAFSGTDELYEDPQFNGDLVPLAPRLRAAGAVLGGSDFHGKRRAAPPTIGAIQYQHLKTRDRVLRAA